MRSKFKILEGLVWLTQVGLSVLGPLLFFVLLAVWLRNSFSLGGWIVILGIVLGLLGMVGGLINTFRLLHKLPEEHDKPAGFNDHE